MFFRARHNMSVVHTTCTRVCSLAAHTCTRARLSSLSPPPLARVHTCARTTRGWTHERGCRYRSLSFVAAQGHALPSRARLHNNLPSSCVLWYLSENVTLRPPVLLLLLFPLPLPTLLSLDRRCCGGPVVHFAPFFSYSVSSLRRAMLFFVNPARRRCSPRARARCFLHCR